MPFMIRLGLALTLSVAALAACGDPVSIRAQFDTVADTVTVFALTGTPIIAPTALSTIRHEALRLDPSRDFDIVFDINATGQAVLYPVQLVGGSPGRTGIQVTTESYDAILEAPLNGYARDSASVLDVGDVALIEAEPPFCATSLYRTIYSKIIVDEIDLANRSVTVRIRVDPNCGFRSLAEGLPER
ncbi:MAG TPA: hypothetical protein VMM77_08255 [Gemmatimonadaceae bacterium]|nr:hypothetical protein [Gemmatimonadaceae bacterium]